MSVVCWFRGHENTTVHAKNYFDEKGRLWRRTWLVENVACGRCGALNPNHETFFMYADSEKSEALAKKAIEKLKG